MVISDEDERPPKPIWGNEITILAEPKDSENENIYYHSPDSEASPGQASNLTPMEEYLKMSKGFIQSKSLPPCLIKRLKRLLDRYEAIDGYGPSKFESVQRKDRGRKTSTKSKKIVHPSNDTSVAPKVILRLQDETPSTSKQIDLFECSSDSTSEGSEEWSYEEYSFDGEIISTMDIVTPWYGLPDFMFGRPCDPDMIHVDDVFSDFTLRDAGQDNKLKQEIKRWMDKGSFKRTISTALKRIASELFLGNSSKDSETN